MVGVEGGGPRVAGRLVAGLAKAWTEEVMSGMSMVVHERARLWE